jgi:hypothetical protein
MCSTRFLRVARPETCPEGCSLMFVPVQPLRTGIMGRITVHEHPLSNEDITKVWQQIGGQREGHSNEPNSGDTRWCLIQPIRQGHVRTD